MPINARLTKLMSPKHLKSAEVRFTNAKRGSHDIVETYARRSSPLHRGANATRTTTVNGSGQNTNSSVLYQPAKLTKKGKYTAAGLGVGGYGAVLAAPAVSENRAAKKERVKKDMSVSVWGVDHGEEISKLREPKRKTPVAQRGALHRPTPFNSRGTNAAKWAGGGAAAGGAYGSAFGAKGVLAGAAAGGVTGGALGAAMPSKKNVNAKNMQHSVQQSEDNEFKYKTERYKAKKGGTWKQDKHGIQNRAMQREHARVANYFKASGDKRGLY